MGIVVSIDRYNRPPLPAGTYEVEGKGSFNHNGDLRSGKLEAQLTMA